LEVKSIGVRGWEGRKSGLWLELELELELEFELIEDEEEDFPECKACGSSILRVGMDADECFGTPMG